MKTNIPELTDEALLQACRKRPWERWLSSVGCSLALVVGVLAVFGTLLLFGGGAWFGALIMFVVSAMVVNVVLDTVVDHRTGRYQEELRRRLAPKDLSDYVREAERSFEAAAPPDWVLLFRGHGLPHGGTQTIRVWLWQSDLPHGRQEVHTVSDIDFRHDPPFTMQKGEEDLGPSECAAFLGRMRDLAATPPRNLNSTFIDGFPCGLTVLRREPRLSATHRCNLVGIAESDRDHPAPRMMELMLATSGRVTV